MLNQLRSWLAATPILLGLMLVAVAQPVQLPDKTLNPIDTSGLAGPPTVKITEAKTIPGKGNQVRVKWTAQVPNLTKLESFDISLNTRDSEGKTTTTNQTAAGSVRELVLQVPLNGLKFVVSQTTIVTSFTTLATQKRELNGTFLLGKQEGSSGGPSSTPNANDAVTKVTIVDGSGFKSFDVFWRISRFTQGTIEKQSKITGTFTYKRGAQVLGTRTATTTVSSDTRQARLTVSSSPVASLVDVRIEAVIKVETFFTVIQRITTTLSGNP